ncbi:hypothetical protein JW879_06905 [candidate division WOR-3 bacterium]|nr:hypothetical protein [candidate division WOR-3 bacterium]
MYFKRFLAAFIAIFILSYVGCAYIQTQVQHYKGIEEDFTSRFYSGAAEKIEKAGKEGKYEGKDKVLYYLDMGIALHFAGRYEESNQFLDKAEVAIEENFTRSISKMMISFLLNDNVLDYAGEDYEDIFINVIKNLNYIHLNKKDEAMVEIRRTNLKLNRLQDKYSNMAEKLGTSEKLKESEAEFSFIPGKTNLRYSITGSYLSMLGYKSTGKWDDVKIDRMKLLEASSGRLENFSKEVLSPGAENTVPVYTLCFAGRSPVKIQATLLLDYDPDLDMARIMMPGKKNTEISSFKYKGDSELHLKFAVPEIVRRKSRIRHIRTLVNGQAMGELYLIEDFGGIAEETFNVKKPLIYLRAALRTLIKATIDAKTKENIDKKYEEKEGEEEDKEEEVKKRGKDKFMAGLLKFAVDAVTDITENADLRCWRTMPGRVYAGKIDLPPGEYEVAFEYLDERGKVVDLEKKIVFIDKNDMNLLEGVSYR